MTILVHPCSRFRQRTLALLLPLLVSCGGEDLVLPDEGVPTSIVVVDGNDQSGTIGTVLAEPVVVRVLDVQGRPVPGQQVTFTVITGGGAVAPPTPTTNANGEASSNWTLGPAAGTQQLRARATGGAAPPDLSVAITATASASAAVAIEAVSGGGQAATAGSTLSDSLIVRVTDAAQNPVAGVAVTWTVTGGGSVSEASTVTGADGRTGVRRTLGTTAGPQTTIATVAGLTGSPVTFPATATVGSAGQLVVTTQPSATASSGAPFAQQPRVQIQDANGNNVAANGRAITAELASGPGGSSLTGTPTVATNANGLAIFSGLGITGPAGSYTLNFTGADLSGATSNPITLTAGAATRLAFTVQPSNTTAGSPITPAVRVTVHDALGQTVTTATTAVTLSIGTNPGSGTLGGTTTVNAVAGVATFSSLSFDRAATGYRLAAGATGLTGATSAAFNIAAGPASAMTASATIPATTTAGSVVVPDAAVRVTDAQGNPVAGISVTFAEVNGGSVAGETQTTNAQGIATVGSWTIGSTAGTTYQLRATATGLTPVTFSTTAVAGAAGMLTIETQPAATAQSGVALSPQPRVQLRDGSGNPVNQSGIAISAQFGSGPTASLSNATASTNGSGVATFSGLTITGPAGTFTLTFSGPGISGVASDPIVLGSGSATKLGMITQPPGTVENGALFDPAPVVQLQDAAGNAVGTPGVNIDVTIVSGAGVLNGTLTATTNSSGEAVFPNLRITGSVGSRTLRFSADIPITTVNSSAVLVTPGPVDATKSMISAAPSTITASEPGTGATITVTALDQSNNAISGAAVELNSVSGGGSFSDSNPATGAGGTASATYTSTVAGPKIIGATINGVPIVDQQSITVNPATAMAENSFFSVSPGTITIGGTGATATVTARDQFNNLVSGASVVISVTSGTATPGEGLTNSSGHFTATITSGTAGTQTVSVTVEGEALPDQTIEVNEPPNEAPTAAGHAYGATEDQALSVPAPGVLSGATDTDGTIAGAVLGTAPVHGTLDLETDGSFTYIPDAEYSGPDGFTYRAVDEDAAQSADATVSLTVAAVNDAPSFTAGAPPSASSADGPQAITGWAGAIAAGPGEAGQTVSFEVTTNNDAAFATLPSIASDGTLTFEAAAVGEATGVTVTIIARDDGGTASGGVDTSAPVQVTFTIQP